MRPGAGLAALLAATLGLGGCRCEDAPAARAGSRADAAVAAELEPRLRIDVLPPIVLDALIDEVLALDDGRTIVGVKDFGVMRILLVDAAGQVTSELASVRFESGAIVTMIADGPDAVWIAMWFDSTLEFPDHEVTSVNTNVFGKRVDTLLLKLRISDGSVLAERQLNEDGDIRLAVGGTALYALQWVHQTPVGHYVLSRLDDHGATVWARELRFERDYEFSLAVDDDAVIMVAAAHSDVSVQGRLYQPPDLNFDNTFVAIFDHLGVLQDLTPLHFSNTGYALAASEGDLVYAVEDERPRLGTRGARGAAFVEHVLPCAVPLCQMQRIAVLGDRVVIVTFSVNIGGAPRFDALLTNLDGTVLDMRTVERPKPPAQHIYVSTSAIRGGFVVHYQTKDRGSLWRARILLE